jgi:hypothetical protein
MGRVNQGDPEIGALAAGLKMDGLQASEERPVVVGLGKILAAEVEL